MKHIHIMTDIETLGKGIDPIVTQISAVAFDIETGKMYDEYNEYIHIPKKIEVDSSTLSWWLSTNPKLLMDILSNCEQSDADEKTVIENFTNWLNGPKGFYGGSMDTVLWGNGILFDNRIISEKCLKYDIPYPIYYRNDRDMRTIVDLAATKVGLSSEEYREQFQFEGTQHNAIDDVKHQIKVVCEAYKTLGLNDNKKNIVRSYNEIKACLKTMEEFQKEMPLKEYDDILRTQERISHCGYPDYMPQAGAEGTYISLTPIPNSDDWVFEYNKYLGGPDEIYETRCCIVSSKEKDVIISHWDEKQRQNELAYETAWIAQCEYKRNMKHN